MPLDANKHVKAWALGLPAKSPSKRIVRESAEKINEQSRRRMRMPRSWLLSLCRFRQAPNLLLSHGKVRLYALPLTHRSPHRPQ